MTWLAPWPENPRTRFDAAVLADVKRWDAPTMRTALAVLGALDAPTMVRVVLAAAVRDELTAWEDHPELARWLGVVAAADPAATGRPAGDPDTHRPDDRAGTPATAGTAGSAGGT